MIEKSLQRKSILLAVFLAFSFCLFWGCGRKSDFTQLIHQEKYNYILISIDTLRPDRLHCYGFSDIETPVTDEMAEKGVKFEKCISQTPLTLPSHTTLLTGTHPFFHGVKDNGGFVVPQELKNLAELFKEKGYATGAVVGAYVLDSKWGLAKGFNFYYDRFDISRKEGFSLADVQRKAREVIDLALNWLEGEKGKNFFLFVHLYDPHSPYEPPPPFDKKYAHDLYLGEVAYTDSQLGRLWKYLKNKELLEKTIVVFCSDHGESLGEHGEATHGFFVYQEGIHVPLIFALPFAQFQNLSSKETVSLVDIMPTLLEMANIPIPSQVQGKSLIPYFAGSRRDSFAYAETYYARFHYGWSEVRSIQNSRYKLILSPQREVYDLVDDPEEEKDIATDEPRIATQLEKKLNSFLESYSQGGFKKDFRRLDEETQEKLASLGYIGTFIETGKIMEKVLPSPREKIKIFNQISLAKELSLAGKLEDAQKIMMKVIQEEPEIIDAYFVLGNIFFKQKNYPEAIKWLSEALERKPDYDFVILNMAISYIEMNDLDKAEAILARFISRFEADSLIYLTLGDINLKQEDYPQAIKYLEECLRFNPLSPQAHNSLARVYIILDNSEKALFHALKAKELSRELRNLHYNLAQIYELKGELLRAEAEYLAEIETYPDNFNASFNLALLYRRMKDDLKEELFLKKTIETNPRFPLGYLFLGELYSDKETLEEKAISHLEQALSLGLDKKHLKLAYYLLAKIYLKQGKERLASEYAQRIKQLE